MSRRRSSRRQKSPVKSYNYYEDDDAAFAENLDEDEQLRLVLELSMKENGSKCNGESTTHDSSTYDSGNNGNDGKDDDDGQEWVVVDDAEQVSEEPPPSLPTPQHANGETAGDGQTMQQTRRQTRMPMCLCRKMLPTRLNLRRQQRYCCRRRRHMRR